MAVRPPLNVKPREIRPPVETAVAEDTSVTGAPKRGRSRNRIGKRAAMVWLEPEAVKQLGVQAIQRETTVQDLLVEAVNNWFALNNLPRYD